MTRDSIDQKRQADVAIIGSGPTGLMAAELAAKAGRKVVVCDRMRQPGRKFLLAGSDGLNLTHDETLEHFAGRYDQVEPVRRLLQAFSPQDLRSWVHDLGEPTFVGSSGRVFPQSMKASPLLRAWLARLAGLGVVFKGGQTLRSWDEENLYFDAMTLKARSTVLAMGGASWPRFGTDGAWQTLFPADIITSLTPSNCRFPARWSAILMNQHDGGLIKNAAVLTKNGWHSGDLRIVKQGLEGGPVYAAAGHWQQEKKMIIDLLPNRSSPWLQERWNKMPAKISTSAKLKRLNLKSASLALVSEMRARLQLKFPDCLKGLTMPLDLAPSMERAISTRGGVKWQAVDEFLAYKTRHRTYIGGEMLDWDAPTGGYLLQACFSMGHQIGLALGAEPK